MGTTCQFWEIDKVMKNIFGILLAGLAFGQPVVEPLLDQVYRIAHIQSDAGMHEIATTIGAITDIKKISVDTAQKTLVIHATPTQMAMARWLLHWLDQPPGWQAEPAELQASASDENDVLRVLYLHQVDTDKDFQELLTAIRSLGVSHKLFSVNASRAAAVRGTRSEVETVTWLANQLDRSAEQNPGPQPASPEYRIPGGTGEVIHVFYLPRSLTIAAFQQLAQRVQNITDSRTCFTYNALRALAMRGTAQQVSMAAEFLKQ